MLTLIGEESILRPIAYENLIVCVDSIKMCISKSNGSLLKMFLSKMVNMNSIAFKNTIIDKEILD